MQTISEEFDRVCPLCGSMVKKTYLGFGVCTSCGYEVSVPYSSNPPYGLNYKPLYEGPRLGTKLGTFLEAAEAGGNYARLRAINNWKDNRRKDYRDRGVYTEIYTELNRITSALQLPHGVFRCALNLIKKIRDKTEIKKGKLERGPDIVPVAVYIAARSLGIYVNIKHIYAQMRMSKKRFSLLLKRVFALGLVLPKNRGMRMMMIRKRIDFICSELKIPAEIRIEAYRIASNAHIQNTVIDVAAAACIGLALIKLKSEKIRMVHVAEAAGVSLAAVIKRMIRASGVPARGLKDLKKKIERKGGI